MVKVISTGRSPHLPQGVEVVLPEADAEVLVSKGAAVYEGTVIEDVTPDNANEKFSEVIKQDKPKKKK